MVGTGFEEHYERKFKLLGIMLCTICLYSGTLRARSVNLEFMNIKQDRPII